MVYLFLKREGAVDPMDIDAIAFHAAEPGHLPFGEAADVGKEVSEELIFGTLTQQIACEVSVFKAVAHKSFRLDTLVE